MKKLLLALMLSLPIFGQAPSPKPQPTESSYSVNELGLFPSYTRESFESTFGKQAPAYDPKRPIKNWFDSTQICDSKNNNVTYTVVSPNLSAPALVPLVLSSCDASSVNLKGTIHYDTFRVAPSNVVLTCKFIGCVDQPVSPMLLSTLNEALALKAEINTSAEVTEVTTLNAFFSYKKISDSNPYSVYKLGNDNVGQLLYSRNQKGVGYPGKWTVTPQGTIFKPDLDNSLNDGVDGVVLPPVRELLPNEKLVSKVQGIIPILTIERTDVSTPNQPSNSSSDSSKIDKILQILEKLFAQ